MTDPTPRTAATAREYAPCKAGPGYVHFDPAMVAKCLICTPCTHASYTTRTTCDRCHQTAAEARPNATAATARERDVERVLAEALHIPEWPCDHRQYDPPQCVRAARSILAGSPTLPAALAAAPSEFRALVDEARANHVRWEHEAEVLEECIRPLCIGAKVLLWPDIENPRSSVSPAPAPTPSEPVGYGGKDSRE